MTTPNAILTQEQVEESRRRRRANRVREAVEAALASGRYTIAVWHIVREGDLNPEQLAEFEKTKLLPLPMFFGQEDFPYEDLSKLVRMLKDQCSNMIRRREADAMAQIESAGEALPPVQHDPVIKAAIAETARQKESVDADQP